MKSITVMKAFGWVCIFFILVIVNIFPSLFVDGCHSSRPRIKQRVKKQAEQDRERVETLELLYDTYWDGPTGCRKAYEAGYKRGYEQCQKDARDVLDE